MSTKRIARILAIAVPSVLLGLLAALVVFLNTGAFRGFLKSELQKQALQRAGVHVDIGDIELRWIPLRLELKDSVVHGREDETADKIPLFRAKDVVVSIRFLPLFRKQFRLRTLVLEEPMVHLGIDAQGNSNIPPSPNPGSTNTAARVFDLEVGDFAIHSGEIYYNNAEIPLDAEVHDLKLAAAYATLSGTYKGSLAYDRARVTSPRFAPVESSVQLQFTVDRSGLSLNPLVVASGASRLTIHARLTNYSNPNVDGAYSCDLRTSDVAKALRLASLPVGQVALDGSLAYHPAEQRSFLENVVLRGNLRSAKLSLRESQAPLDFTSVAARYELSNANLNVETFLAEVLGGRTQGSWEMRNIESSEARARLDASLQNISLARASDVLSPRDVRRIPVVGTAKADVSASWTGPLNNLIAHFRVTVSSPPQASNSGSVIPVNALVQADYDGPRDMISLGQSYVQTRSTKINAAGLLSSKRSGISNISVQASTSDLGEAGMLTALVRNALSPTQNASLPMLGGSASLQATVTGTAKDPQIDGQLGAQNLVVEGSRWKSLELRLSAQPSGLKVANGVLMGNPSGKIAFNGNIGLQHWSLPANGSISLHAAVNSLPVADAQKIARRNYPVTGIVSANISVQGTRQNPAANGTLTVTHGSAWNQAIDNVTVNVHSEGGEIRSTASVRFPPGTISAQSTYRPATGEYEMQIRGSDLQLAKISTLENFQLLQGAVDLSATGQGTLQNPAFQANLTAAKLQIRDQAISGISAQLGVADHHANVVLHATVYQGSVEAKADVNLVGNRYANAGIDIRALPLAPVLAAFVSPRASTISGQTEIHLTLKGPADHPEQMEGHLEIPTLSLGYGKAQLALAQPLHADYSNGALTLMPTRVQGTGTDLTLSGTVPIRGAASPSLSADGTMDLGVVHQFDPDVRSSGQVIIHVKSQQGTAPSAIHGELQIKDAVLSAETIPVGIEGVNAQINLSGNRADIVNFSGAAGGGSVSASGFLTYGRQTNFSLALTANSVRLRYPEGLRSVLSGQLNLQGSPAASALSGKVSVDRLSFTQAFDLANFATYFSGESSGAPASSFKRSMKLNIAVQSAQDLNLASSKVSVAGSAKLNLTGTLADPILLGRIALSSGEVFFLSKRFEIQSGTIEFANPVRTNPVLNLHVTTTVEQYQVTLNLSGPVDRLKTTYTSDPALPPADIIHLLAFGKTAEESASAPTSSAATSAESVLAQGVSGQVAGKLENLTGISQLTIDPLAANNQGNPGAQIAIQERVTGSLLLTFSTDVTSTQSQTVELQYQFNRRLSVTVLRDQNGGYGIDVRLHKEF